MIKRLALLAMATLATCSVETPAFAALTPDQIGIIAVAGSRESRAVAAYYARVRKVPQSQIFLINVTPQEELTRAKWQRDVRPAIRQWLIEKQLISKLRCLVTVWDVPLKITNGPLPAQTAQVQEYLQAERISRIGKLNDILRSLHERLSSEAFQPIPADASLDDVKQRLDAAFSQSQTQAVNTEDETERGELLNALRLAYFRSVGLNMMAQSLGRQMQSGSVAPQVRSEFDVARGRTAGLREGRVAMEGLPISLEREPQMLAIIQLSDGLYGSLAWIDEQLATIRKNENHASFDSELALVAWNDYQTLRWQPNLWHYRFDDSPVRQFRPTFMVSRIEAPTLPRTRGIIDEAIAAERDGLKGKIYLDARGSAELDTQVTNGSYPDYDQSVLQAAEIFQQHSELEVVLDKRQELFQPGTAPDAALYCGWYSLANYVDAFDWKPGAIGYHMASSEASTLRDPESEVWCKQMLQDGACAVIGPVYEPYIMAFPRPNEFFPLLASGKHTLVEAYFRCLPFTSWTMVLIGDPLYNPFQSQPALNVDALDTQLQQIINGTNKNSSTELSSNG